MSRLRDFAESLIRAQYAYDEQMPPEPEVRLCCACDGSGCPRCDWTGYALPLSEDEEER